MAPDELAFKQVLREGSIIAGIMLFWSAVALVGIGIRNIGGPGSLLISLGDALFQLFIVTALGNALLYIIARGIALSR